ncbi:MAG: serine/threonine-protein kinase, partial [Thermocrispum sp.]
MVARTRAATSAMEGTLIGDRYRLSQPIGRGRGGFVWIAQDARVQRTVAAKPIALRGPQDAGFALEQAKHAARLKHQCAVTVYDVLADGQQVWIITEYVPSRTMSDFITGHGRLDATDTATLGTQLSAALAAAHEIELLHRAIEPPNVLLADDGGVQITDFGIGALHSDEMYQAPEVVAGGAHTAASDVFALGATLFYAVEGADPFGADGSGPTLHHLSGTPLQPVLMRMLSVDPSMRPTMEGVWT